MVIAVSVILAKLGRRRVTMRDSVRTVLGRAMLAELKP
jgi:hypothetical protein